MSKELNLKEELKKHFEANLLDGDAVQKSQMIASTEVLEYIQDAFPEIFESYVKACKPEERVEGTDYGDFTNPENIGFNFGCSEYQQNLLKELKG